jgi:tetratricopeptide (TPR) repeat protein
LLLYVLPNYIAPWRCKTTFGQRCGMPYAPRTTPIVASLCFLAVTGGYETFGFWWVRGPDQNPSSLRIDPTAERSRTTSLRIDPTISARTSALRVVPIEIAQKRGIQQVGEALARTEQQVITLPKRQPTLTERAAVLAAKGRYQEAIPLYQQALQANPKATEALAGWGRALLELGREADARDKFLAVLALNPRDAAAQVNLGVACYRTGDIDRAIQAYQAALAISPRLANAHFNLGMAQSHRGELEAAIASYQTAIKLRPQFREAWNNLGLLYEALGDLERAEQAFRAALGKPVPGGREPEAGYALAHYNLGRLYEKRAAYDAAIREFQTAVRQQPNFPEAYLNLGNVRLLRSQLKGTPELDAAIEAFRKAIALRQGLYPLAYENLAIALSFKGDKPAALAAYRTAFDQYEGASADTFENLLTTLADETQFLIGNELTRSDNPGNLRPVNQTATKPGTDRLLELLERYAGLPEALKEQPDVRYCAGRAYITIGQAEAARNELRRGLELAEGRDASARELLHALEATMAPPP